MKCWLDVSYSAHDNMPGHTGGTMSMNKYECGSIISILKKQKKNRKSLTEADLIGVDD